MFQNPVMMNTFSRRNFLRKGILATAALVAAPALASAESHNSFAHKRLAKALQKGQTVGLIAPGGAISKRESVDEFVATLEGMGLKAKIAPYAMERYGYLAGTDEQRAADLNLMFADPEVDAIIALRGGWGCARILDMIDYDQIKRTPKILMGYSDITALLLAIEAKTGLITFHGPVGLSSWNEFSIRYVNQVLWEGKQALFESLPESGLQTLHGGVAEGKLVGGNLSVIAGMTGSKHLPKWKGAILFLEEIDEEVYRIDRMLTQLKLAGILDQLAGFVFGQCTDCQPKEPEKSLTLQQILETHIVPLGIPAFTGAQFGHVSNKFTLPVGARCRIDANAGTLQMLEPAVIC